MQAPIDPSAPVDPALLDTGNYPTELLKFVVAGTPAIGAVLEAQRMLSYLTGPWQVDPTLLRGGGLSPGIIASASALNMRVEEGAVAAAERHRLVNAVYTGRQSDTGSLTNTVMRFPDAPAAAAAVPEMIEGSLRMPALTDRADRIPIPGHPGATAVAAVDPTRYGQPPWHVVSVFSAHGPYVLHQYAESAESREAAARLAGATLDRQGPLIDQFRPTDPAQFPMLPVDPTRLRARTLPIDGKAPPNDTGVYDSAGALHFQSNPIESAALFDRAGMKLFSNSDVNVYEAAHPAGATTIAEEFLNEFTADYEPADPVPNLETSRCLRLKATDKFTLKIEIFCTATADKYAIEAAGSQLQDIHQRVAAQYVMLTAD